MASYGSVWRAMAVVSVIAVVAMAGAQACSLNDVVGCTGAVTADNAPSTTCCGQVATVNAACFCNLVATGNYQQDFIDRAVAIPKTCGGAAYANFRGLICAGHTIQ